MSVRTMPLGEVAEVISGGTPKRSHPGFFGGDVPWVKIGDMLQGEVTRTDERITDDGLRNSSAKLLPAGTLLLSIFATIGRTAVLRIDAATNQAIAGIKIRDPSHVDRNYLRRYLERTAEGLADQGRGVAQANINLSILRAHEIPLPPIEDQRRVAGLLDAADVLRSKRRQAVGKLDSLSQAVFLDMFGGGQRSAVYPGPVVLTHPRGWSWVPIIEVATMGTGHTPDRDVPEYWDGDISWINLTEIRRYDGQWCRQTEARITEDGVANSSAVVHPIGTVCFSRTASIGFVTVMASPMTTSQDFVTWTCGRDLNPDYLMYALLAGRRGLRASSSGSTHKTIYVRDAERFRVLLPPRTLQDEFANRVHSIRNAADLMSAGLLPLETLFASLQQQAFRGEL